MSLHTLGWTDARQSELTRLDQPCLSPARVSRQDRERYLILTGDGEFEAQVSGRFRHQALTIADYPAVGDWVAVELRPGEQSATIHHLLARTGSFSRKVAGRQTEQQVVAANVDTVLLVNGLDGDFNPRRIERYVTSAWESGARPVVVLNKADVCDDVEVRIDEVRAVAFGLPVHAVSASTGDGIDELRVYLAPGQTVALLGSSGVGKTSLINALIGEAKFATGVVSEHLDRGRHTTTHRELIPLEGAGVVIDTPGMRELQLWSDGDDGPQGFDDIERLAADCRFADCTHRGEPGCAVVAAVASGKLDPGRLESFHKLGRELAFLARRQDKASHRQQDKARGRMFHQYHKQMKRMGKGR